MKSLPPARLIRGIGLAAALLSVATSGHAQTAAAPAAKDDPIVLNPFDVTAGANKGYMATNTISGTAMNTPLKDVPMAINVITAEFLADSLVGNFEQALDYNSAITQTSRLPVSNRNDAFAIRGFRNRNTLVDGVIAGEFIPPQMIDRIEIVKGPNTLYGQSDPGGLINVISKRPQGRNRLSVGLRGGDNGVFGADFDGNVVAGNGRLGLRLVGAHNRSDGYRILDDNKSTFVGVAGDVKLAKDTTAVFHVSGSETDGISSQRSTFSFELIPTDLNRDGRIDGTIVNGIAENTARYNNTFLPRDYTSATDGTRYEQESKFLQFGLRQRVGRHANIQYMFVRTDQDMDMTFREFNTFNPAGSSDANHSAQLNSNRTDAHTINSLFTATTGPLTHRLLVGGRYIWDQTEGATHSLRTLGPGTERPTLDRLIAQGRRIRLFLTKNDVLSGVKYWLDDTPTAQEMRTLGTRGGNVYMSESRVSSAYVSDSIALLDNRLKLLTGLRYVRIRSQSTNTAGAKIGRLNDQDDTSYQLGATYDLTPRLAAYANTATAFNPNGFDDINGIFFDPELSRAYEAGLKFEDLWSGRLGGSISVFQIRKKNVRRSDYNPVTFRSDNEITDDESRGWETELFYNPAKSWQLVLNYSRIDAKVIVSRTAAKNLALEGATPHRLTLWSNYSVDAGPLKGLRFGGGMIHAKGPIQQFGTSNSQLVREDGYTTFSVFARYPLKLLEQRVALGLNVDNLTNVFFMRSRAGTNNPRQIVFSVRWDR
ncbi:MAG: TonB-dependent receptor [Opitutaceae bacterium]|nr:TonB-dependent receptor [Opitutaceae bacterium]